MNEELSHTRKRAHWHLYLIRLAAISWWFATGCGQIAAQSEHEYLFVFDGSDRIAPGSWM